MWFAGGLIIATIVMVLIVIAIVHCGEDIDLKDVGTVTITKFTNNPNNSKKPAGDVEIQEL